MELSPSSRKVYRVTGNIYLSQSAVTNFIELHRPPNFWQIKYFKVIFSLFWLPTVFIFLKRMNCILQVSIFSFLSLHTLFKECFEGLRHISYKSNFVAPASPLSRSLQMCKKLYYLPSVHRTSDTADFVMRATLRKKQHEKTIPFFCLVTATNAVRLPNTDGALSVQMLHNKSK
jgi:hypothetical protein